MILVTGATILAEATTAVVTPVGVAVPAAAEVVVPAAAEVAVPAEEIEIPCPLRNQSR